MAINTCAQDYLVTYLDYIARTMRKRHISAHRSATADDRATGLWAVSAGHFVTPDAGIRRPHPNDFLALYCVRGGGWFELGAHAFEIRPGRLFISLPDVPHGYGSIPDIGWEIWWVHFDGDLAHRLVELTGHHADRPVFELGLVKPLVAKFAAICKALRHQGPHGDLDATTALFALLLELRKHRSGSKQRLDRLVHVVEKHPGSIDAMAGAAGMSKYRFIRTFRSATGLTPWRFLTRRRINRAKQLLTDTALSIKEISYKLGFSDPNYFSRLFHKEAGVSAKEFRRRR